MTNFYSSEYHNPSLTKSSLFMLKLSSYSLIIFLFTIIITTEANGKCPPVCECMWKKGKSSVSCKNQSLILIPIGIDFATQVLNLDFNNFQSLPNKTFQERGLINLQKIHLSNCKLGIIANDAFVQLTNLIELHLSSNFLVYIPTEPLSYTKSLRKLYLNKNPIRSIAKNSFIHLNQLVTLDLSDCQIDHIELDAFEGLTELKKLKLDGNRLTSLSPLVIKQIKTLYELDLHKNPWNCDCNLRSFVELMRIENLDFSLHPSCATPEKVAGLMWNSLDLDDFACPPIILTREFEKTAKTGDNVTFVCTIKSSPISKISWLIDDSSEGNHLLSSVSLERNKYNTSEINTLETVTSYLIVYNVSQKDAYKSYICNGENSASHASKNFTLYVLSTSSQSSLGWSKLQKATIILTILIALVIIFVLFAVFLLRTRSSNSSEEIEENKPSLPSIDIVKKVPNGPLPKLYDKNIKKEPATSSGYGSNGVTPDLTSTTIKNDDDHCNISPSIDFTGLLGPNDGIKTSSSTSTPCELINNQQRTISNEHYYNNYENYNVFNQAMNGNLEYNDFNTPCLAGGENYHVYNDKMPHCINPNIANLHHVNVIGQGSYNISHHTIVRYSPDEGYAEEQANIPYVLEGTEV